MDHAALVGLDAGATRAGRSCRLATAGLSPAAVDSCDVDVGAGCQTRTDDLMLTRQLLYQLS